MHAILTKIGDVDKTIGIWKIPEHPGTAKNYNNYEKNM